MYKSKIEIISANKNKLDSGLKKLFEAKEKISNLEKELEIKTVEINKIKIIAEENDRVAREQAAIVGQEAAIAEDEERKVTAQAKDIGEESDKCEKELNNLKPLMETALRLANGLEKKDLDAVKAIKPSPPAIILEVLCAILIMVAGQIDSFIKIEIDNKRMPKKMEKGDRLALLNDANTLKKAFDEFLEMIKSFKDHNIFNGNHMIIIQILRFLSIQYKKL